MKKENLLAIFKLTEMATNLGNQFANMKNVNDAFALNKQKMDYASQLKREEAANLRNIKSQENANKAKLTEINELLEKTWKGLNMSGVVRDDLPALGAQFRTDEFEELLDENEATLTEDFVFTSQTANTFTEQQNRFQFEIDTKEKLLNELNPIFDSLQQNEEHIMKVGTSERIPLIKDYADIMEYVNLPENESVFKEPDWMTDEDGTILIYPEGHELAGQPMTHKKGDGSTRYTTKNNYLVQDLLQETRTKDGVDYGHKPKYKQAELNLASVYVNKQNAIQYGFDDIDSMIANLMSTEGLTKEDLGDIGLLDFKQLKGTSKSLQDPDNLNLLKDKLADSFFKIASIWGTNDLPYQKQFLGIGQSQENRDMYMMRIIKDWIVGEKALNADGSPMLDDKGQPIYSAVDGDASGGRFNSLYEDENGIVFNAGGAL